MKQAKADPALNIPHNEWNEALDELIAQATDLLETDTRRALITQSWMLRLPAFPENGVPIETRKPPLQSVTKIDYIDGDGVSQEWDAANYDVDTTREPGLIRPKVDYPATQQDRWDAVQVTFVAGYGDNPTDMPGTVTHALKLQVKIQFSETESGAYERNAYDALVNRLGFGSYP